MTRRAADDAEHPSPIVRFLGAIPTAEPRGFHRCGVVPTAAADGRLCRETDVSRAAGETGVSSSGTRGDATGWVPPMTVQVAWHVAMEPLVDPDAPAGEAPVVELVDVVAVLGTFPALAGASLVVHARRDRAAAGPQRRRQDHAAAAVRRPAAARRVATGECAGCDLRTQRAGGAQPGRPARPRQRAVHRPDRRRERRASGERPSARRADEIDGALERMGLAARLADVPVGKLSAGQKRRTALACLVARRAELWLLDEPHAGLDAAGRDELDATLRAAVAGRRDGDRRQPRARARRLAGHACRRRGRRPGPRRGEHGGARQPA